MLNWTSLNGPRSAGTAENLSRKTKAAIALSASPSTAPHRRCLLARRFAEVLELLAGVSAAVTNSSSSGLVSIGPGFYQNPGSVTLNLDGFAPINFDTSFLSVESEYNAASFYDTVTGNALGVYSEDLGAYDLTTAIDPVTGFFITTSNFSELSSEGLLTITGGTGDFTFSAQPPTQVTPEPSSLLLLSTGLLGVAGIFRRTLASRS